MMFERETHSKILPKALVIAIVAIIIGMLMAFLASGLTGKSSITGKSGEQLEGGMAPDFTAFSPDRSVISLSDYRGSPVILNFWASWCPPCREETPILQKVWVENQNKGIVILAVNVQDREEDALQYLAEFGVTFPNVYDKNGGITVDYGVTGLPVTFFVDRRGEIVGRWVGSIGHVSLSSWAESLLVGVLPVPENTNSLGK